MHAAEDTNAFRANHPSAAIVASFPANPNDQVWHLNQIMAQAAYARNITGAGVNVMVVDSSYDTTNDALVKRLRLDLAAPFYVQRNGSFSPSDLRPTDPSDDHGTHVAGIIVANKFDNVGTHGVAYAASVIPIGLLDKGATSAPEIELLSASRLSYFATLPNVMVYNASYGPPVADTTPKQTVWTISRNAPVEEAAALRALKAGKIIVAAASNDRQTNETAANNPSGLALLPFLNPAHANLGVYNDLGASYDFTELQRQSGQIIGVMSLGLNKAPAVYSNFCGFTASWCVAAPRR